MHINGTAANSVVVTSSDHSQMGYGLVLELQGIASVRYGHLHHLRVALFIPSTYPNSYIAIEIKNSLFEYNTYGTYG